MTEKRKLTTQRQVSSDFGLCLNCHVLYDPRYEWRTRCSQWKHWSLWGWQWGDHYPYNQENKKKVVRLRCSAQFIIFRTRPHSHFFFFLISSINLSAGRLTRQKTTALTWELKTMMSSLTSSHRSLSSPCSSLLMVSVSPSAKSSWTETVKFTGPWRQSLILPNHS